MNNGSELSRQNANSQGDSLAHASKGFYPAHFVHLSLPYRKLSETYWHRKNGHKSMTMTAGTYETPDGEIIIMVPYGKYARLALMYLCTESARTKSPRVELSRTLRGFMRDLGLKWDSREAKEAVAQLRALLAMQVSFTNTEPLQEGRKRMVSCNFTVGSRVDITFEADGKIDDRVSYFLLSNDFYEAVVSQWSVPMEHKVWAELVRSTKSPMALDIYLWLNARIHNSRGESSVSWEQLSEQFGSNTSNIRKFKEQFRKALDDVLETAPQYKSSIREVGAGRGKTKGLKGFLINPRPTKSLE